ncbi:hypothetical protein EG344_10995 [Chryseobacterium sp. G0162]|uniref:hypothetical protein n=1 Tax=Chryseobacterium sp. G0162 TaxID=2487063 RepID=UPI000F4D63D6|nr:hypothetical protein [Chryseobacterium sp. G0162]AZB09310.1 hypothetical protein EG344_10995 [Chryseobacterium sp. G0162]
MTYYVEDINEITLDVFTIGYSEKGESQVILLYDNVKDQVLFSFVIDCYSTATLHKTKDILDYYKISNIDYFIWTHTDEDHSVGIDILVDNYCSAKTNFYLPEGIDGTELDIFSYNQDVKNCFEKINSLNKQQNYNVHTLTLPVDGNLEIVRRIIKEEKTTKQFNFQVFCIAPLSAIIKRRKQAKIAGATHVNANDFSIATVFKVGELSLLFSGDIENQTINLIPDYHFEGLSYVKTPHHTSNTSTKLLDKIEKSFDGTKIPTAVTTTYKAFNLPKSELIEDYRQFVTSFNSTGRGPMGYGYVKTVFNIIKKEFTEELVGDATKHF